MRLTNRWRMPTPEEAQRELDRRALDKLHADMIAPHTKLYAVNVEHETDDGANISGTAQVRLTWTAGEDPEAEFISLDATIYRTAYGWLGETNGGVESECVLWDVHGCPAEIVQQACEMAVERWAREVETEDMT